MGEILWDITEGLFMVVKMEDEIEMEIVEEVVAVVGLVIFVVVETHHIQENNSDNDHEVYGLCLHALTLRAHELDQILWATQIPNIRDFVAQIRDHNNLNKHTQLLAYNWVQHMDHLSLILRLPCTHLA